MYRPQPAVRRLALRRRSRTLQHDRCCFRPGSALQEAPNAAGKPGLSHMTEHGEEKGVVPASTLDFATYGLGVGMRSQDVESEPAQDSEVLGSIVLSRPVAVLVEVDVEDPVQLVLDGPVAARDLQQSFGGHVFRQQVVAHDRWIGGISAPASARGDAADGSDAWETMDAGQ